MMASNAAKVPLLRAVTKRSYAAQAAAQQQCNPSQSTAEVVTTVLPNKLVVSSVENSAPIARVSVLFRAGARNETPDNIGTSHILRVAAGLTTKNSSKFGITRNIQQIGGNLSARSDRESIAYTVEANRDDIKTALKYLSDVSTKQAFKPWELADNVPRVRYELASRAPQTRALNLLHRAAFRSGLGNSVFCPKYLIGKIGTETLQDFVACTFRTNRAAVVGVGVDHASLVAYAQGLSLESGPGPETTGKYFGGEIRKQDAGVNGLAHVAVAVEGVGLTNAKEALAFAALQYALGTGPSIKWQLAQGAPLAGAVSKTLKDTPFAISALNISYTDAGLFGFVLSTQGNAAGLAVTDAVQVLRAGCISDKDASRGKAQLTAALLMSTEGDSALLEEIGVQSLLLGGYTSSKDLAAAASQLTTEDINKAAKKVSSGKLSLAAVGNLCCIPYLDQL